MSSAKHLPSASVSVVAPPKVVSPRSPRSSSSSSQQQQSEPGLGVQLLTAGTAACVADLFTFPLDTAKVRLQVRENPGQKIYIQSQKPTLA